MRDKAHQDNPGHNGTRVQLLRASIYGCSVALQAFRDQEIDDLVHRIEKIEETMKLKAPQPAGEEP